MGEQSLKLKKITVADKDINDRPKKGILSKKDSVTKSATYIGKNGP